jgi:EmrB/QacA subfamily drug resistance transporter
VAARDHADQVLFVEVLDEDLGAEIVDYAEVQIDCSVPERGQVFLSLGDEAQTHPRCGALDLAHEAGRYQADEGVVGADREGAFQRDQVETPTHVDQGVGFFDQSVNTALEGERPGCRDQAPPGSDQDRVIEGDSDSRQGAARGRDGQMQPGGGGGDAPLRQEHIEGVQQVQVYLRHTQSILANMSLDSNLADAEHGRMAVPSIQSSYQRRRLVLATLCLSVLLVVVANMALNVALPTLGRTLPASTTSLAWVVDLYVLCFAGLLLPAGALGDRFGRKGALQCGLVIFIVAAALGSQSGSTWQLMLARAAMGVGAAGIMPGTLSILATVFPPAERARAIAIWASVAGGSVAVSIIWSGFMLEHFWWGSIFIGMAIVGAAALVAGYFLLPTSRHPDDARLDPVGALLSVIGVAGLLFGFIQAPQDGWTSPTILAAFALGVGGLVAFTRFELRSEHPMLDIGFFRERRFALGALSIAAAYFALFGMYFVFSQYLQLVRGYSPVIAGAYALPAGLAQFAVAHLSRPFVARHGLRPVLTSGLAAGAAGLLILAASGTRSGPWIFEVGLGLIGAGIGLTMPPATGAIMSSLPPHKAGVGSAVNDLVRELGGAFGIGVLGSLTLSHYQSRLAAAVAGHPGLARARQGLAQAFDVGGGPHGAVGDLARRAYTQGLDLAMIIGAGFVLAAAIVVYAALPSGRRPPPDPAGPMGVGPQRIPSRSREEG